MVVIDTERTSYRVISHLLGTTHRVEHYEHLGLAMDYVREHAPDVVFLNVDDEACDSMGLLGEMSLGAGCSSVVAMIGSVNLRRVVDAVQRGACDVLAHPLRDRDLHHAVTRALARQQRSVSVDAHLAVPDIVGSSSCMLELRSGIRRVAQQAAPVIITGESGVGKELVARAIHSLSAMSAGPFEARNCGAFPDTLFESELFGTEKGAYTGAVCRPGAFELANAGTLFLDEIGELNPQAQVKLLRVLETGTYHRVGGTHPRRTSARIVVATNCDLRRLREEGRFRDDLYYRIDVLRIEVAPLRDRREDIPILVPHLMSRLAGEGVSSSAERFAADALEYLSEYAWPGNVRELRNVVCRAMIDATGKVIRARDLTLG
ncbi:MAG: sigma-54-dependent transcriptional regulator [Spirochaetota bacterium]